MLRFNKEPDFIFDPDKLGHCFFPFERVPPSLGFKYVEERVIAPVPNKAKGLKGEFIAVAFLFDFHCLPPLLFGGIESWIAGR